MLELRKNTGDDRRRTRDWQALRERIGAHGMRHSNCVAIAPTATISNIIGVSACIEPAYQNLYVKSNLSGEFAVVNEYLVRDLKKLRPWDEVMVADLKFFDGSLERIDQAQSLNICMAGASGRKLHDTYMLAWLRGLKTTCYLRTLGATSAEKSTTERIGQLNAVTADGGSNAGFSDAATSPVDVQSDAFEDVGAPKFCAIDDPECEACQ